MNANYTKEACYFAFECTVGPLHMLRWLTSHLQCRPTLFVFEDTNPGGEGVGTPVYGLYRVIQGRATGQGMIFLLSVLNKVYKS